MRSRKDWMFYPLPPFFFKLIILTWFLKESQQGCKGLGMAQWRLSDGGWTGREEQRMQEAMSTEVSWGLPFQQSIVEEIKWWGIICIGYGLCPEWMCNRVHCKEHRLCYSSQKGSLLPLRLVAGAGGEQGEQPAAGMLAWRDTLHWAH